MAVNSVYPGLEMNLGSGIYLGVEVFLYAVHVSVIVVLIAGRKKLFNNCFYTTVTIICIEDVIHYIVVVLFVLRFTEIGLWTEMYLKNEWIASAGYTFSRALMYSQLFGHTTIAFNRFTLFWMPYKYNSIWERPWYIIVMTFLPICCVLYGIDDPGRIEYQNGVLIAALKLPKNYNFANIMSYVVYIGNTAVSFILSMLALAKYRIMRTSGRLSGVKIKDRRLLMYTIVVLAFQCIKVCYLYLRPLFIGTPSIYKMLMNAVPVVYLLHALICSLSVIIICHSSRRAYTRFYVGLFLRLIYRRGSLKYPKKLIIPSTSYPTQQTVPAISCIKLPDGDKVRNA